MIYRFIIILLTYSIIVSAQNRENQQTVRKLSLEQTIALAKDSSLNTYLAKNTYLSSYWRYRTFKAERLPLIGIDMTPFSYHSNFVKRYDSENNVDVYKSQQSMYSFANFSLRQNVDLTGGTFFFDTELGYLHNFGLSQNEQYSSVPFRIGYSQSLFGFNRLKWEKKIEPLRYEKASKEFILELEEISELAVNYFFEFEIYQKNYELAALNVLNSDTLYQIGKERYKIGSLSHPDLLTLELETINSKRDLENAELSLKKSTFTLAAFLRLDNNSQFELNIPDQLMNVVVAADEAMSLAKENNPTFPALKENKLTAQQNYDKTLRESRFSASLSASVGFNQVAANLSDVYVKPLQQDVLSINLSVPIVDWGVRKGRVNIAKEQLNIVNVSAMQTVQSFEQELLISVYEFNLYKSQIDAAKKARDIAEQAFYKAKQLFAVGKTDVNTINLSVMRQINAELSYISSIKNYWMSYYKLRKLTLYDFVNKKSIASSFSDTYGY